MQIFINIPDEKIEEFKIGFLAMHPIPIPNPANPEILEYTELQWLKMWIKQNLIRAYQNGKRKLAIEDAKIDAEIIT